MVSLVDSIGTILSRSERQVEVAGQNVSNVSTPGYKRILDYRRAVDAARADSIRRDDPDLAVDFTPGKLMDTGRSYDIAIAGPGFFVLGSSKSPIYTRVGQFDRDGDGRLVNSQGLALQMEGGGDLVTKSGNLQVSSDGAVLESGSPIGKIAIVAIDPSAAKPLDGGGFTAPDSAVSPIDKPSIYQGKLEGSNVSMGAEMVSIMGALRRAETGQRFANMYDDLMGRVLQTVGQSV